MRKTGVFALVLVGLVMGIVYIYSCGGGNGGQEAVSVEGSWYLYYIPDGAVAEEFPIHMTLTQSGADFTAEFTCNDSMPIGNGTFDGTDLNIIFDFGQDGTLEISGMYQGGVFSGTFTQGTESGTWRFEETVGLDCSEACNPVEAVKFVASEFIDLDKINEISLFRSAAGHDYSDDCESCRSMKHYYAPYDVYIDNSTVEIYAPVDGTISSINTEQHGDTGDGINKQIVIRSDDQPDYAFVIFHTDLTPEANSVGKSVTEGDIIGYAHMYNVSLDEYSHDCDIAVRVYTPYGIRNVSFFEVMTDPLFAEYEARGAVATSDFIISRSARDADELTCDGETFTSTGTLDIWFSLDPKGDNALCESDVECLSGSCVGNTCTTP